MTERICSWAGLSEPWMGRATLVFRRTAWFAGKDFRMVGLMTQGIDPAPCGVELFGVLPPIRKNARLVVSQGTIFLEGVGTLGPLVPDREVFPTLPEEFFVVPPGWKARWLEQLRSTLPRSPEGQWLLQRLETGDSHWRSWLGRGSGSTPSGDDFLGGWWAAMTVRKQITASLRDEYYAALPGTSALSRHYLSLIGKGRVDQEIAAFLKATVAPEPESPEAFALASRGDLSGRALLAGLVAGLTFEGGSCAPFAPLRSPALS